RALHSAIGLPRSSTSASLMLRLRIPAEVRRNFNPSAAVVPCRAGGVLPQLARELGRYVGLDLDPTLAVAGCVERTALAHTLHERAGRVRHDHLHALPLGRGELPEPHPQ